MQICVLYKRKILADSFSHVSVLLFQSRLIQIFNEEKRMNQPVYKTLPLLLSASFGVPFWCSTVPSLCKAVLTRV